MDSGPARFPKRGPLVTADGSTADPSTTSSTFVLLPEMTLSITTVGRPVRVSFRSSFTVASTAVLGDSVEIALFVDTVQVTGTEMNLAKGAGLVLSDTLAMSFTEVVQGLAAGAHTIEVKYRRPGANGAAKAFGKVRRLQAREEY